MSSQASSTTSTSASTHKKSQPNNHHKINKGSYSLSSKQASKLKKSIKEERKKEAVIDDAERLRRFEIKRAKRAARRQTQDSESSNENNNNHDNNKDDMNLEQPSSTDHSSAKLSSSSKSSSPFLSSAKPSSSSSSKSFSPSLASVSIKPHSSSPLLSSLSSSLSSSSIPSSTEIKHPKKKDDNIRAAERAERKRARLLQQQQSGLSTSSISINQYTTASSTTSTISLITEDNKKKSNENEDEDEEEDGPKSKKPKTNNIKDIKTTSSSTIDDSIIEEEQSENKETRESSLIASESTASSSSSSLSDEKQIFKSISAKHQSLLIDPNSDNIPLSSLPFTLHPSLLSQLQSSSISSLFPIQATVIPTIISQHNYSDICVGASTGSGKTLCYILPILHILSSSVITRLRALIVLPTKDLCMQVYNNFLLYNNINKDNNTNLKIKCINGSNSFKREQSSIMKYTQKHSSFNNNDDDIYLDAADDGIDISSYVDHNNHSNNNDIEYSSNVDVLICTPGRLIDHLSSTYGFTLSNLEFLVIDEVDRLLIQHYQDWMEKILTSVYSPTSHKVADIGNNKDEDIYSKFPIYSHHSTHSSFSNITNNQSSSYKPLQKLLFSATLTTNPQQLSQLKLKNPIFLTESQKAKNAKFRVPNALTEYMCICEDGSKPLYLLSLLLTHKSTCTVIFTSSLSSCHRLYRLLELLGGFNLCEYSSLLSLSKRNNILKLIKLKKINILICSDVMARGLDVNNIDTVINYDVPVYITTYIHRVGRTARATNKGTAFTLVRTRDIRHFRSILSETENSKLLSYTLDPIHISSLEEWYISSLSSLKTLLAKESQGVQSLELPIQPKPQRPAVTLIEPKPIIKTTEDIEIENLMKKNKAKKLKLLTGKLNMSSGIIIHEHADVQHNAHININVKAKEYNEKLAAVISKNKIEHNTSNAAPKRGMASQIKVKMKAANDKT